MINDKVAILLSSYSPYCRHCAGVRHPVGVALSPHPGRPQQDRHQEHPAALTQGEVLPHEDDDAQVRGAAGRKAVTLYDCEGI